MEEDTDVCECGHERWEHFEGYAECRGIYGCCEGCYEFKGSEGMEHGTIKVMWDEKLQSTVFTYEFETYRSKSHTLIVMAVGEFDSDRAIAMIDLLDRKAIEAGRNKL